jgi:chemotaxis protein MotB
VSRKKKHEHVNHERWLVSYADFITLLFAFFVVLFASSQSDKKKQMQIAAVMQTAFTPLGTFEAHSKTPPLTDTPGASVSLLPIALALPLASKPTAETDEDTANQTAAHLRKFLETQMASGQIPQGSVTLRSTTEGLVISLREIGFFPSGSAEIRTSSIPMLAGLAAELPASLIRVEGHTDDMPIHTAQYVTNWELSTARSCAIARILLEHSNLNPADLAAAGYAEYHPVASNATEAGRAQNRRVDIILLRHPAPSQ